MKRIIVFCGFWLGLLLLLFVDPQRERSDPPSTYVLQLNIANIPDMPVAECIRRRLDAVLQTFPDLKIGQAIAQEGKL